MISLTRSHTTFDLASLARSDLEESALGFLQRLQKRTGETNLCLVGGVAQNSVLNGRIAREAGFDQVFIPPYPGDEGIALGCAAYARSLLLPSDTEVAARWTRNVPFSAYQGRAYSQEEVAAAIDEYMPWLDEVMLDDPSEAGVVEYASEALAGGEILCWAYGKAEVGARALGHRSILADPRAPTTHKRVNTIKRREQYRPLAPSVLSEEADGWFDGVPSLGSPYMQITAAVRPEVQEKVPAITHVDGSARLQTVAASDVPLYHALILAFFALSGGEQHTPQGLPTRVRVAAHALAAAHTRIGA